MLSFITNFRDTFDTVGVSEAAAVCVLAYFMVGDAKDAISEQLALVEVEFDG